MSLIGSWRARSAGSKSNLTSSGESSVALPIFHNVAPTPKSNQGIATRQIRRRLDQDVERHRAGSSNCCYWSKSGRASDPIDRPVLYAGRCVDRQLVGVSRPSTNASTCFAGMRSSTLRRSCVVRGAIYREAARPGKLDLLRAEVAPAPSRANPLRCLHRKTRAAHGCAWNRWVDGQHRNECSLTSQSSASCPASTSKIAQGGKANCVRSWYDE